MPTIEISQEQAAALTRGESISIRPERHYIVTTDNDNVWSIRSPVGPVVGQQFRAKEGILIGKGPHQGPLGLVQAGVTMFRVKSFVEVPE